MLQLVLFAGFFIYLPYWFIVVAPTLPQQARPGSPRACGQLLGLPF